MKRIVKSRKQENEIYPDNVSTSRPIYIKRVDEVIGYVDTSKDHQCVLNFIDPKEGRATSFSLIDALEYAQRKGLDLYATNKNSSTSKIVLHDANTICESDVDYASGVIARRDDKIVGIISCEIISDMRGHVYAINLTNGDREEFDDPRENSILSQASKLSYKLYVE